MVGGNEYVMVSWVNCTSPGGNHGGTKFAFEGDGGDILGSIDQRHDTNSSGQYVCHIGQFTAPSPPQNIGIYRKRIYNDGHNEETDYGQCFVIDLSYSGLSGTLISGTDYSSSTDTSVRTTASNNIFHSHTTDHTGGTTLILAACKSHDTAAPTPVGLLIDGTLEASGSRYSTNNLDMKTLPFAAVANISSGTSVQLKNLDTQAISTNYSYVFSLNLDTGPAVNATGRLSSWTDHGTSGTWGTKTIDGNNQDSFVIAMGRQTATGVQSGRMASISLYNNTTEKFLLFNNRPSGNYNALYYPATNPGASNEQLETSVVIGVGVIGDADEIEITTL